jgi:putative ABC transport system permease protein
LSGAREQEIVEELALQLEQAFNEALAAGTTSAQAEARAENQIPDWTALAREIRRAEQPVTEQIVERIPQNWHLAMQEQNFRKRRGGNMFADLFQDLRYALRMLRKSPGFAFIIVLTLALGIGANSTIFSVINAVLLRPLPYPESDRLVYVDENNLPKGWGHFSVSPANFVDWRGQSRSFERIVALSRHSFNYSTGDLPEQWGGLEGSQGFLEMYRVRPEIGRSFSDNEFQVGNDHVVLISNGLWKRAFGSDPAILGRHLLLGGESFEVIGVMPPAFQLGGPNNVLWLPLAFDPADLQSSRGAHYLTVMARLLPNITVEQAGKEMSALAARLAAQYPVTNKDWGAGVQQVQASQVKSVRPALLILLGAVGFVLLIACSNAANMLLARATVRRREIAIRTALGAGRLRVVRQLLTESVILAIVGGALGLGIAYAGMRALVALRPAFIPRAATIHLDTSVLLFTAALALATGILFGLAPALSVVRGNLSESLKEGGRSGGGGRAGLRKVFVVVEVALAFVLLVGAGLLVRSFSRLTAVEPGFNTQSALTFLVPLPRARYSTPAQQIAFYDQAQQRLAALPGVASSVLTSTVPLSGDDELYSIGIAGAPSPDQPSALYYLVGPDYLRQMGIQLLAGREFTPQDNAVGPHVCIVNDKLAQTLFPGRNPIGQRIQIGRNYSIVREIVGVAATVKHYGLDEKTALQVYEPFAQLPRTAMLFVLRTQGDPMRVLPAARHAIQQVDAQQPVTRPATMEEILSESVALPRFRTLLLGLFGALAATLAAVGLYGVMSYTVTQQTQEIGVRMALGAQRMQIFRLMVGRGMFLVLIGVVIGGGGAFALTRSLESFVSFLFGVKPNDPLTLAGVTLLFAAVAAFACWLPARRASRVDPLIALRYE